MVVRPHVLQTLWANKVTIPFAENVAWKLPSESEHPYSLVSLLSSPQLLYCLIFSLCLLFIKTNKQVNKTKISPTFDICYLVPF